MEVRWSPEAAADLEAIIQHIQDDSLDAAQRVAESIIKQLEVLKGFPRIGKEGRVAGTLELALSPLPYVAVYRLREKSFELIRVLHGAQRWP